jgi:hypothetical protein
MKEIYKLDKIINVYHDEIEHYLVLRWKSFNISLDEIKKMHKSILEYAVENKSSIFIADTSETVSTLNEEIIKWWKNIWIPILINNGIKMIITILPRDIIAQMSTFEWQKADYGKIKMLNVLTIEQAQKIIKLLK